MLKLKDLTSGERLFLARRRRNERQREAARRHGVSYYRYRAWECDGSNGAPLAPLHSVRPHEACLILRRRFGLTLDQLAEHVEVTPTWLCQMEQGKVPCTRLIEYWESTVAAL